MVIVGRKLPYCSGSNNCGTILTRHSFPLIFLMRKTFPVVVCALAAFVAACSQKETAQPPVAKPTVTVNKEKAPIGSPLKITYKFEVQPNATFDGNYSVFVHVLDPDGEKLWQDDHQPSIPTSAWKPGQVVEYTRTVFIPNYPYIGEAIVRLGLYNPATGRRLTLDGQEASRQEYVVLRLQLLPQSENIFIINRDGWHGPEIDNNDPTSEWQWTKKTATLSFRNPKRDSMFYLEFDARPDLFNPPQQITVSSGGQALATFAADSKEKTLKMIPVTAAQLGGGDMADISIDIDRTFTPGGADARELGVRIFHTFIEPR